MSRSWHSLFVRIVVGGDDVGAKLFEKMCSRYHVGRESHHARGLGWMLRRSVVVVVV